MKAFAFFLAVSFCFAGHTAESSCAPSSLPLLSALDAWIKSGEGVFRADTYLVDSPVGRRRIPIVLALDEARNSEAFASVTERTDAILWRYNAEPYGTSHTRFGARVLPAPHFEAPGRSKVRFEIIFEKNPGAQWTAPARALASVSHVPAFAPVAVIIWDWAEPGQTRVGETAGPVDLAIRASAALGVLSDRLPSDTRLQVLHPLYPRSGIPAESGRDTVFPTIESSFLDRQREGG